MTVIKFSSAYIFGIIWCLCFLLNDCVALSISHHQEGSFNNDSPSSTERYRVDNQSSTSGSLIHNVIAPKTTEPPWRKNLLDGKWYGSENYMKREMYLKYPNTRPTVCYNNETADSNGTVLYNFICPKSDQKDHFKYCCGLHNKQHCCTLEQSNKENEEDTPLLHDLDIVTGISIAVGFVLSVTVCLSLYCCCCQRRPEIHDGIKLMWVRRSFGKELNRIEQPMYQNHLTVGGGSHLPSRGGSRNPSRGGSQNPSRSPSRNASRNASRECSPSVSRRGSHRSSSKRKDDDSKTKLKPPSGVTITLTTPSDEQGPTNPLLKQTKERIVST